MKNKEDEDASRTLRTLRVFVFCFSPLSYFISLKNCDILMRG